MSISSINLPLNTCIEMQKQAILSTCWLNRKVFNQK
jgi:hypothetical protein